MRCTIEKNRLYHAQAVQFEVVETYAKDESQGPRQTVVQGLRRGKCEVSKSPFTGHCSALPHVNYNNGDPIEPKGAPTNQF